MSTIELIHGSCADQTADAVVNAANPFLLQGGGICGVIFRKAGAAALTKACSQYPVPLADGDAVLTPAFGLKTAKCIIHAVGPDFGRKPRAFEELYSAYFHSLARLKEQGLHSVAFPLISAGIYGGNLENPVAESVRQCCRAYGKFVADFPEYPVQVKLCAFSRQELQAAQEEFRKHF